MPSYMPVHVCTADLAWPITFPAVNREEQEQELAERRKQLEAGKA